MHSGNVRLARLFIALLLPQTLGCQGTSRKPTAGATRPGANEAQQATQPGANEVQRATQPVSWVDRRQRPPKLTNPGPSPQGYQAMDRLPAGVEHFEYHSGTLNLQGWFVKAQTKGRAPTLVYLHGGFAFGLDDLEDVRPFYEAGFNLFAPTWRGENGNPGVHELAYGEVEDAVAALAWVAKHPAVDPARIHVLGHSAGGMISALLAAVPDLPVKETASVSGIYSPEAIAGLRSVPFDTSDPMEAKLRSLLTFEGAMHRDHVAYVGKGDERTRRSAAQFGRAKGSKLQIVEVPGDHFQALASGVQAYLKRVTTKPSQVDTSFLSGTP